MSSVVGRNPSWNGKHVVFFRDRVKASRIPEVVRTPDSWLGNRTILETLRADGPDPIYTYLGRLFSYSGT